MFLDGTYAFGLWRSVATRSSLRVGQELSIDQQRRLLEMERFERERRRAMIYLAHKPRTMQEVRNRLRRADCPNDVAEAVVVEMTERGLLDDAAYTAAYVETRMSGRGYGPHRIRQELVRRGVERRIIKDALDEVAGGDREANLARSLAEKRWHRLQTETDDRKRRKRLMDYLVRRGFSYEIVRETVDRVAAASRNPGGE